MSERFYSQVEAFKMLLNGKRMRPVNSNIIEYCYVDKNCIMSKYVGNAYKDQKSSTALHSDCWVLVEESVVKAGELFKKRDSNYIAVGTGTKALRLVDLSSWTSDSSINVYGMTASDIEKRYGITKV